MRIWHQSFSDLDRAPVYRQTLAAHAGAVLDPAIEVRLHGLKPGTYGALGDIYRNGVYPGRAPDFIIVPRPYWMYGTLHSAAHGTPWLYDRTVPLVLFGGGVKKGELDLAEAIDVAPTLAALVGAPPPPSTTGRVLVPIR